MAGNTFGQILRLTTFGESHGTAIGGILDGMPPGVEIDMDEIELWMNRRRPGQSEITTTRNEDDRVEILSGTINGATTGAPIGFIIQNKDNKSKDYDNLKDVFRPSHADYTWQSKYGIRDHRGGGRSSARETATRVAGGAIAFQFLKTKNIQIAAWVDQVGHIRLDENFEPADLSSENLVRCPDPLIAKQMIGLIGHLKETGNSVGGAISFQILGVPAGLGEPVFDKLHADLAKAMMSINAVKGFEIGSGFGAAAMLGSQHNDSFEAGEKITTSSNNSGGIQGGISNGMPIRGRVAFKPVATIKLEQQTVNTSGESVTLEAVGRHDPCVVPRAVVIVEAMASLVIADHWLRQQAIRS